MKIIDNKKDYYDFYAGIYGIDDKVVYDRRKSIKFDDFLKEVTFNVTSLNKRKDFEDNINKIELRVGFSIFNFEKERIPEEDVPGYKGLSGYSGYVNGKNWIMPEIVDECIGWREYIEHPNPRRLTREELEERHTKFQKDLEKNRVALYKKSEKNLVASEIPPIEIKMWQDYEHSTTMSDLRIIGDANGTVTIYDPILQDFPAVCSFISPDTVWQEVYSFITVMSEKVIVDNRSDTLKLESAGFDKKTSFRNVK